MLTISGSAFAIARRVGVDQWLATSTATAATPLAVFRVPYFMGSTHIPGIALTLLALAFFIHRKPVLAGIPLATVVYFKFVMLPLAIVVLIVWAFAAGTRRTLLRTGASFAVTGLVIALILRIRGELVGFVTAQINNILYSQSPIVDAAYTGFFQKIAQHIVILVKPNVLAVELTTMIILVAGWIVNRRRKTALQPSSSDPLWWATAIAFLPAVGIITATRK